MAFVHLRSLSHYSIGKSNVSIEDMLKMCVKTGAPAICLSDHGNLFGALEFSLAAVKNGIQPIFGCSLKVDCSALSPESLGYQSADYPQFLIIAKNETGYRNLVSLVSESYLSRQTNHHKEPCISLTQLEQAGNGLMVFIGSRESLPSTLYNPHHEKKRRQSQFSLLQALFNRLKEHVELFCEIQRYSHDHAEQEREIILLDLAYDLDIPIVATNPICFLTPEDQEACDALYCISSSRYLAEQDRPSAHPQHFFKTEAEMRALFQDLPEAIDNSILVARKSSFILEKKTPQLPSFASEGSEADLLCQQAREGLAQRLASLDSVIQSSKLEQYQQRLEFELKTIIKMDFAGYFLIVADFIQWSKAREIPVGVGRGSGVGSVVAWALRISDVDPIAFDLLFERFLNPERISMPDFDIDFCQDRRDEAIQYVRDKYGHDRVAQIITYGKLKTKAVLRDVGRVLQLPYRLIDRICKIIPNNQANPITLAEAIALDKELQQMRDSDPDVSRLLRISLQLEGVYRHVSTHAAGVVIANKPFKDLLVPLYLDNDGDMPAVQYNLKYAELAGLVKFDFLGLKTLTVNAAACKLAAEQGNAVDLNCLPLDDASTYKLLSTGKTKGIFQFDASAFISDVIRELKPDCIGDLIALTSLNRPGPMDNIPHYIARKHGREPIEYPHPKLQQILEDTHGIIVYQEQVMQIAQLLAGYSLGEADILRRAMGKKIKHEMEQQRVAFVERSVKNGIGYGQAEGIFHFLDKFANYGFNKSHAVAYSIISYHTAYLKTHHTIEFLTASINVDIGDSSKVDTFCREAKLFNIEVSAPCINKSDYLFTIDASGGIRFGLGGLKGANSKVLQSVIAERMLHGPFPDLRSFAKRCVPLGLNKRLLEILAKSGALSTLYANTAEILANIDQIIGYGTVTPEAHGSLFSLLDFSVNDAHGNELREKCAPWSYQDMAKAEYEALGFYLNQHPLKEYEQDLQKMRVLSAYELEKERDSLDNFSIAGVIISRKIRSGKTGKFAFIELSDPSGSADLAIFDEKLLSDNADLLNDGSMVLCQVAAKKVKDASSRLILTGISSLASALERHSLDYTLYIKSANILEKLRVMLSDRPVNGRNHRVTLGAMGETGRTVLFNNKIYYITVENLRVIKEWPELQLQEK